MLSCGRAKFSILYLVLWRWVWLGAGICCVLSGRAEDGFVPGLSCTVWLLLFLFLLLLLMMRLAAAAISTILSCRRWNEKRTGDAYLFKLDKISLVCYLQLWVTRTFATNPRSALSIVVLLLTCFLGRFPPISKQLTIDSCARSPQTENWRRSRSSPPGRHCCALSVAPLPRCPLPDWLSFGRWIG